MSNHITIELCKEDRDRLDGIFGALALLVERQNCAKCALNVTRLMDERHAQDAQEPQEPAEPAEQAATPPEEEKPATEELTPAWEEPDAAPQYEEPAPKVSRADLQQKVVALSVAGKKAQVREIVKAYASNVSGVPEDKLAECWTRLTALEG